MMPQFKAYPVFLIYVPIQKILFDVKFPGGVLPPMENNENTWK